MVSPNQSASRSESYDSKPKEIIAAKNDLTLAAVVRGIRDPERAREYINAEIDLADEQDRDVDQDLIGALNRRVAAIEDDGPDE